VLPPASAPEPMASPAPLHTPDLDPNHGSGAMSLCGAQAADRGRRSVCSFPAPWIGGGEERSCPARVDSTAVATVAAEAVAAEMGPLMGQRRWVRWV